MRMSEQPAFTTQILHSIGEVGSTTWDALSVGRPFQSARWYAYGEKALAGCQPTYIIISLDNQPVARATCWLIREEPLPVPSRTLRRLLKIYLHRRPLFICRSPLSNSGGLILPVAQRKPALQLLAATALEEMRRQRASFLVFDFVEAAETTLPGWPEQAAVMTVSDPSTCMALNWESFDAYLKSGNKKGRQHFKRSLREAEKLGIVVTRHRRVPDVESALALIRNVENKHGAAPNPWARDMLENLELADGTFLAAHIGKQLVGCGLIFEDNGAQMTTALGLADNMPYVYFSLVYASLQAAFEKNVHLLRWGSGAYDVKRRLGFQLESNNHAVFFGAGPLSRLISRLET